MVKEGLATDGRVCLVNSIGKPAIFLVEIQGTKYGVPNDLNLPISPAPKTVHCVFYKDPNATKLKVRLDPSKYRTVHDSQSSKTTVEPRKPTSPKAPSAKRNQTEFEKWRDSQKTEIERKKGTQGEGKSEKNETIAIDPVVGLRNEQQSGSSASEKVSFHNDSRESKVEQSISVPKSSDTEIKGLYIESPHPIECNTRIFKFGDLPSQYFRDYLYKNIDNRFCEFLDKTGTIGIRYKLLSLLALMISRFHKSNQIIGHFDVGIFVIDRNLEGISLSNRSRVSYKTSILTSLNEGDYISPEVRHLLYPTTPMSEVNSYAQLAYELLSGKKFIKEIEKASCTYIPGCLEDIMRKSLSVEPMDRPDISRWIVALNSSLDDLISCPRCGHWYPRKDNQRCPACNGQMKMYLSVNSGILGMGDTYDPITNTISQKRTVIGRQQYCFSLTETTGKIMFDYHLHVRNEVPKSLLSLEISECNTHGYSKIVISPIGNVKVNVLNSSDLEIKSVITSPTIFSMSPFDYSVTLFEIETETIKDKFFSICHI